MDTQTDLRKIALIAGAGYLVIFITGLFANFLVIEGVVDSESAATTISNILENTSLFKTGIIAFVVMVLADLVLAWALYIFFTPVDRIASLFAAWFRVVNVAVFGFALTSLFDVLSLVRNPPHIAAMPEDYLGSEVMQAFSNFNYTWLIGLLFFGIHLVALGALALKAGYIPKFIGILLIIAGFGYLVDSTAQFLLDNYADYEMVFSMIVVIPGVVGELSFTIWLLLRGGKTR